jgi:carbon-monoxide dehydrogenase medium subunit
MKPAPFDYVAPTTIRDAIDALHVDSAKLLAGGQSLVPMLAMRLARPSVLVDLNRVPGLNDIHSSNGTVTIGSMTRIRTLESDPVIRHALPVLANIAGHVGHLAIRNRGTVGGSIVHADPAGELPLAMSVLDASFELEGPRGTRTTGADGFFQGALTTAIEADEILTEIHVPVPGPRARACFLELARRHGDFAIVAVMVLVTLDQAGAYTDVRIGIAGASPTAVRVRQAESKLQGARPSISAVDAAGALAAAAVEPSSDVHGTAAYRREMAETLTRRALLSASGIS